MIGIFDSGVGGLTVFKSLLESLPEYDYMYLGDNSRAPYGNKSHESITEFTDQAVKYLFDAGATLIIFACNTASSVALRELQRKYILEHPENKGKKKILGVLIPMAENAVKASKSRRIGVVGTKATINSQAYDREILKIDPSAKVYSKPCPLLVPFIEEGWQDKPEAISILKKYLRYLKSCQIDTLLLGCTHYPFMLKHFERIMGKKVQVVESGPITAQSLSDYLIRHPEIENLLTREKKRHFLTTGNPDSFKITAEKYLSLKITQPQHIEL